MQALHVSAALKVLRCITSVYKLAVKENIRASEKYMAYLFVSSFCHRERLPLCEESRPAEPAKA